MLRSFGRWPAAEVKNFGVVGRFPPSHPPPLRLTPVVTRTPQHPHFPLNPLQPPRSGFFFSQTSAPHPVVLVGPLRVNNDAGHVEGLYRVFELIRSATDELAFSTRVILQIAAALTVPSVLLKRRGRPTSAIAWLLVLFAVPAIGTLAWWIVGRTRIDRRLRKHAHNKREVGNRIGFPESVPGTHFDSMLPARARGRNSFSTGGNRAVLLTEGKATFAELEAAIENAQICVHLLFYIFKTDETGNRICRRLEDCAKRGVEVRVLLDGFGSGEMIRSLKRRLCPSGVRVGVFFPARFWPLTPRLNFVNHRKLVTIDNRIGFTGGINIGDEYKYAWRDLMVKMEGPCVEGLNHIFLEDWFFATREELSDPRGTKRLEGDGVCDTSLIASGPDTEDWIHDAYFLAITSAKERLYISTPYFIPTPALLTALRTASGRGVDVRIVLPSLSDVLLVMWASRSFYRALVSAGVRIYEYSGAMLHAKALVVDREILSVGTANIDNRSFRLNFELSLFLANSEMNEQLSDWLGEIMSQSEEITSEILDEKSMPRKLAESAAHLLSPLL